MPSTSATSAPPSRTLQVLLLAAAYLSSTAVLPSFNPGILSPLAISLILDQRPKLWPCLYWKHNVYGWGFQLYNAELYLSDFPTCDLVPNLGFGPQYTAATSKRVLLNRITQASLMGLNGCWIKVVVPIRPCTQSVWLNASYACLFHLCIKHTD